MWTREVLVVNDYAEIVSSWSTTMLKLCPRGKLPCWHCVCMIVNNYTGTQLSNSIKFNFLLCHYFFLKQNNLRGVTFFENTFVETKTLVTPFCLFIWGPGKVFEQNKGRKSRHTVPLIKIYFSANLWETNSTFNICSDIFRQQVLWVIFDPCGTHCRGFG